MSVQCIGTSLDIDCIYEVLSFDFALDNLGVPAHTEADRPLPMVNADLVP